ncbi:2Fe-2S iron-sulfur cluster binding domain-containing protein [Babesia caballi]|uniref:2Fe-2S iron-sulfur cluster binding domain-containing protein n=1 Tax=Babesia caballi TaxID=5871 RepID=A0AAV4LZL0_BABCB|nr:2Fe-2S iron-sulfur cluster binding domain-containing protein [Babesia caballi]
MPPLRPLTFHEDDDRDDEAVDAQDTGHDDGHDGPHDQVGAHHTHAADADTAARGSVGRAEVCSLCFYGCRNTHLRTP